MPKTYTVKQVAEILGYSTNSIYTFLKEKRIKGVRVGRGRFRIPQVEVDRLLLTKGAKTQPAESEPLAVFPPTASVGREILPRLSQFGWLNGVREPVGFRLWRTFEEATVGARPQLPSFFDWLLGILSMVAGMGLSLFTQFFEDISLSAYLPWKLALQTTFIAAGLGFLTTDLRGMRHGLWYVAFRILLITAWSVLTILAFLSQDFGGAMLFGAIAAAAAITALAGLADLAGFTLLVFIVVTLAGPAALLFWPTDPRVIWWRLVPLPAANLAIAAASSIAGLLLLVGFRWSRRVFFGLVAIISVVMVSLAIWFAGAGFWIRAFLLLVLGVFGLFSGLWETLKTAGKPERRLLFGFFGALLSLFILASGAVWLFQTNVRDYATNNLLSKLEYGRLLIEDSVERSRLTLEGAAQNPFLVEQLAKKNKDREALTLLARNLFEANPYFYRVIFASPDGDIIAYYPLSDPFTVTNIGFREYFQRAVTTQKTAISSVFEAATQSQSQRVAIGVPVISQKEIVGVMVGGLAIETLGANLQKMASEESGEYFVVFDQAGRFIVHPQTNLVGTEVRRREYPASSQTTPQISEGYSYGGDQAMIASNIIPVTNWIIAVKAPLNKLLRSTQAAAITVMAILGLSLLLMLGLCFLVAARRLPKGGPSPAQTRRAGRA